MSYTMKPSGVEWIGDIPAHWEVKRVKDCYRNLGGGKYGSDENVDSFNVPCISISDFKHGDMKDAAKVKLHRSYPRTNTLKKETILIEKSGGGEKNPVGRVIFLEDDIEAYYTNFVQGITIVNCSPKLMNYILKYIHGAMLHMNFVTQTTGLQNFHFSEFAMMFSISLGTLSEQRAIASFLDDRTSAIDSKIDALEEKEQSLAELRKSIIHDAVTKGLDPKVPMKASGVDWIGDIPAHWTLNRVKCVFKEVSVKGFPNETLLAATQGQGVIPKALVGWRTVEAKQDGRENFKLVQP